TSQVKARVAGERGLLEGATGQELTGYEIHMGQTTVDENSPVFHVFETPDGRVDYFDGTINKQGTVMGTYMHGLFHNADFTNHLLNFLRRRRGLPEKQSTAAEKDRQYDRLADLVRSSLNMESIYKILDSGISQ
ncbi:MAG: cobyric acid synthase CobQ, partial [Dehalococcoidales bacterium]